jgi:DNA-binding MarR family transcriptional regulator
MGWLCDSVAVTAAVSDRLAEQDLVCRERSPGDGRGQNAVLTDRGLQRLRQA